MLACPLTPIHAPMPLDRNTLTALKRSSLGLDLYLWTAYRTFVLKRQLRLSWANLYRQFGAHPAKASDKRTVDNFRTKCLRELKKIKLAWPELNYATAKGVLILLPSPPAIAPLNQGQLRPLDSPFPPQGSPLTAPASRGHPRPTSTPLKGAPGVF